MRVVVAGGTGFLGSALTRSLRGGGADVTVLTRRPRTTGEAEWNPTSVGGALVRLVDGADAVINLAGEPLDAGRWTDERKRRLHDSRVSATKTLVTAIARASRPPSTLLNASAIGIYGPRGEEVVTEATPAGSGFLADICVEWEREALVASRSRVVLLRTGLVLAGHAGALPRLTFPFRLGVGGPAGSGRQWWSWIHVDDWVGMVRWALATASVSGPINLTAPNPVTNAEFSIALGRALHRPALLRAPAFALRMLFGEMADAMILTGQRVRPQRAMDEGFRFRFAALQSALGDLVQRV